MSTIYSFQKQTKKFICKIAQANAFADAKYFYSLNDTVLAKGKERSLSWIMILFLMGMEFNGNGI